MRCPFCKQYDTQVIDSRMCEEGAAIRRRRKCPHCGQRFTSYERVALAMPMIVKRNGNTREPYSQEKLRKSMLIALRKRVYKAEELDKAIGRIEDRLRMTGEKEVLSKEVGRIVMEELKGLDTVAYIRFGSVYLNCDKLEDFVQLVQDARDGADPKAAKSGRGSRGSGRSSK